MSHLLHAMGFLTRFPLPRTKPSTEEDLVAAAGWFPLAGAAVGAAVALAFLVGERLFGPLPAAALAVAAGILATGGLHLDALADTADGLGCGGDRERMLEVMRDARVGAHGASAIAMDAVLKVAFLAALGAVAPAAAPAAAIAAAALSRWAMVLVMPLHPYARPGPGLGRTFAARVGWRQVALATVLAGALALAASRLTAPLTLATGGPDIAAAVVLAATAVLAAAAAALTFARLAARRLGGLTGDVYGAINEIAEVTVLAVFLFFARGLA